jgi:ABC-type multidrug transport system ATPase subunit
MRNSALETIDLTKMNELTRFSEHQEFLLKLLVNKDSFIRKKIIDQNLYYLNTRLDHYLTALGLPHTIVFQNDLSVTISELGRELSPGNLSRGEMARLSLGLSFSFRDVYESLYQQINLYFIDEMLDSGLDVQGGQEAMKLLRDMTREQGKDVWLISHKEDLITKANVICKVIKENGYTTFSFEEQ